MSFSRNASLFTRFRWFTFGITSFITYSAIVMEPKTETKFNDQLSIPYYPGASADQQHTQSLQTLGYPIMKVQPFSFAYLKSRFSKTNKFAYGHYNCDNVDSYRMIILEEMDGKELTELIKPPMIKCSQKKYNTEIDSTRSGSLFFEALMKLKFTENDEIIFVCNRKTHYCSIYMSTEQNTGPYMHFCVESDLLNDCISSAFDKNTTNILKITHST